MRNMLTILIALLCSICASVVFAKNDLCIALTNYGDIPVEFDTPISPGYSYRVDPGKSATLSLDHMRDSCFSNEDDCAINVLILDGTYKHYDIIEHLPRGSRIIYNSLHQFYIDKKAKVKCDGK